MRLARLRQVNNRIFGANSFILFGKKIHFVWIVYDSTIKNNHTFKERFNSRLFIWIRIISIISVCSTPSLANTPSFFRFFQPPQLGQFQKSPTPSWTLGGRGDTNYTRKCQIKGKVMLKRKKCVVCYRLVLYMGFLQRLVPLFPC